MSQTSTKLPADGPPERDSNVANNQLDTAIAHRRGEIRMLQQQREQTTVLNQTRPVLAALPLPPRPPPPHDRKDGKKIQSVPPPPKGPPPRGPRKENGSANRLHASLLSEKPSSQSRSAPPVAPRPLPRGPLPRDRKDGKKIQSVPPPPTGPPKENYPAHDPHASFSGENPSSQSHSAILASQHSANEAATAESTSSPPTVPSKVETIKTAPPSPSEKSNIVSLFPGLLFGLIKR